MSNLKLVPDAPTPLEKMLLDASRSEQPSEAHKARLRAALGIGIPLSAPPPATPSPTPPAGGSAKLARKSFTAVAAAGVGAAMLAALGALMLTRPAPSPVAAPVRAVRPAQIEHAQIEPPLSPSAPPESAVTSAPPPPVTERAPRAARSVVPPSASADLSEQIRLIEAARAGVSARDAAVALSALDSYAARFPRGAFGQEALVLRIRALEQAGDFARATALAKSFLARFPQSPHVARLKPIAERGASR